MSPGLLCVLAVAVRCALAQYDDNNYVFPRSEGMYKYVTAVTSKAGVCTGAILTEYWVITAAHCLFSRGKVIGEKDAKIQAGIINYDQVRMN
jgi:V8-like Glu-specific endopeptidase